MFPVQLLVILSTIIIINQAAILNYENLKSVTPSYEHYENYNTMFYNKTYYYNLNNNSEIEASYDFNTTDSYGNIISSNATALPMFKRIPLWLVGDIISMVVDTIGNTTNNKKD